MSTYYRALPPITMRQLRTNPPTVEMLRNSPENDETSQCLTDGENNLWAFGEEEITFGRYGGNEVEDILDALERHYLVTIVDEFDDRFHAVWSDSHTSD